MQHVSLIFINNEIFRYVIPWNKNKNGGVAIRQAIFFKLSIHNMFRPRQAIVRQFLRKPLRHGISLLCLCNILCFSCGRFLGVRELSSYQHFNRKEWLWITASHRSCNSTWLHKDQLRCQLLR
jgi:hypothetical protein